MLPPFPVSNLLIMDTPKKEQCTSGSSSRGFADKENEIPLVDTPVNLDLATSSSHMTAIVQSVSYFLW